MEYEIPGEEGSFTWHHFGYNNVQGMLDWMKNGEYSKSFIDVCTRTDTKSPVKIRNGIYSYAMSYNTIPNLMVTGCSAGGTGAFLNYHFIRD
jgi:hypothetical protein